MDTLDSLKNHEYLSAEEFMCLLFRIEPGTVKFDAEKLKDQPRGKAMGHVYNALTTDIAAKKLPTSLVDEKVKISKYELEKWQSQQRTWLNVYGVPYLFNATFHYLSKEWLTKKPPEPKFCVNPLVPIGAVTLLNAHGGTGKSIFSLKMAIHIALGLPIVGAETNGGKVAYMSLEDPMPVVRNRIFKIFNALDKEQKQIDVLTSNKLMIIDRYGLPTYMAEKESHGNIITHQIVESLSQFLKEHEIKCLFVDTFIRTNPLNENDNAEMGRLLVTYEGIAKDVECGVVLIHHLPKATANSTSNAPNRSYSARGASAITDNARSALLLEKALKREAKNFAEEDTKTAVVEGRLIEVKHIKHNYSAAHPKQYLEMTKDGVLLEVFPTSAPISDSSLALTKKPDKELRYKELYECWTQIWNRHPLSRNYIMQHLGDIRSFDNAEYGRRQYTGALDWAIKNGYAQETAPPEDKSPNSKAKYYTLTDIDVGGQAPF